MVSVYNNSPLYSTESASATNLALKSELTLEVQEAFNQFDIDKVSELVEKGISPNQMIQLKSCFDAYYYGFFLADLTFSHDPFKGETSDFRENLKELVKSPSLEQTQLIDELVEAFTKRTLTKGNLAKAIGYLLGLKSDSTEEERQSSIPLTRLSFPVFLLAIFAKDVSLLQTMIKKGADVQNFDFYGTFTYDGVERPYQFINFLHENKGIEIAKCLLEAGCSFDRLMNINYSFLIDLVESEPNNLDDILELISMHFDYRKLLQENERGETDFICTVRHLLNSHCNLKILSHLVEKLPSYPKIFQEHKIDACFRFSRNIYKAAIEKGNLYELESLGHGWLTALYEQIKILINASFDLENIFAISDDEEILTSEALVSFAAYALLKRDYEILNFLKQEGFDFNTPIYYKPCFSCSDYKGNPRTLLGFALNGNEEKEIDLEMCHYLLENGARRENLSERLYRKYDKIFRLNESSFEEVD